MSFSCVIAGIILRFSYVTGLRVARKLIVLIMIDVAAEMAIDAIDETEMIVAIDGAIDDRRTEMSETAVTLIGNKM